MLKIKKKVGCKKEMRQGIAKTICVFISVLYAAHKYFISESYVFHKVFISSLYVSHITDGTLRAYPHISEYRKSYTRIPEYTCYCAGWKKILRYTGKSPPAEESKAVRHDGIREFTNLKT